MGSSQPRPPSKTPGLYIGYITGNMLSRKCIKRVASSAGIENAPGVSVGTTFYLRSELGTIGIRPRDLQLIPLAPLELRLLVMSHDLMEGVYHVGDLKQDGKKSFP
jgi:hypothetical protein